MTEKEKAFYNGIAWGLWIAALIFLLITHYSKN